MIRIHRIRTAGVLLSALALAASTLAAEKVRNHFDTDSAMRPPGFFDLAVLGAPGPARWLVLTDFNPPSAPNKLVQVNIARPADSIAAAVRRNYSFRDGRVSTFVKQGVGQAGLLIRMAGEKDFVVLLVNTASGQAVLTAYRGGQPAELGHGHAKLERLWEQFSVQAAGPALTVFFNDAKLFEAVDPQPVSGKSGLATAGPGEASFDEFILEPATISPKP